MPKFRANLLDRTGIAISGATVMVYDAGTSNLATIYSDQPMSAEVTGSVLTTDADGEFQFFAPSGEYKYTFEKNGVVGEEDFVVVPVLPQLFDVRDFGALGLAAAIQRAIDAAEAAGAGVYLPGGVFVPDATVLVPPGMSFVGSGWRSVIKAPDGLDDHVLRNRSLTPGVDSDIYLANFKVDGNKANQTATATARGIYMIGVHRLSIERVWVADTVEHGIHLSNSGVVEGQRLTNCLVTGPGAGGAVSSSCFALSEANDVSLVSCHAYDAERAGFRIQGAGITLTGCVARRCGDGGILPVSSGSTDIVVNGGHFSDNGMAGIHLVGAKRITLNGVQCRSNGHSGLELVNGCERVEVNGGLFSNNGQDATAVSATTGRDGITIKNDGAANVNVTIRGAHCTDDQGTKTQDYGILIGNTSDKVTIDACDLEGNQLGALNNTSTGNDIRIGVSIRGLTSVSYDNATTHTLTGTTTETDLASSTIAANELARRNGFRIRAAGAFSGGSGTKQIKLMIGATTAAFAVTASGLVGGWVLDAEIWLHTASAQRLSARLHAATTYASVIGTGIAESFAGAVTVKLRGVLGNAADTITQTTWVVEPLR